MKTFIICILLGLAFSNPLQKLTQDYYNQINQAQNTWKAGHNDRWDQFTPESLMTQFGTFLETPEEFQLPLKEITPLEAIPESFDSRTQWPGCDSIKEVRDQSTCGSCWAFGAAEAMSDRLCIASGQQDQTRISTEDLLTCCGFTCGFGCNGGFPSGAWSYFKKTGLVTGHLYGQNQWCSPYTFPPCDHHTDGPYGPCGASQPTPKCVKSCTAESKRTYTTDLHHAVDTYSLSNSESVIQSEILSLGPVEAAFTVYDDFLAYKSGVYQHTSGSQLGGHAIKILGWGVENGVKYWLCANSWNEGWGDNGFFKILRGSNHCGIEAQVVAGTIKL